MLLCMPFTYMNTWYATLMFLLLFCNFGCRKASLLLYLNSKVSGIIKQVHIYTFSVSTVMYLFILPESMSLCLDVMCSTLQQFLPHSTIPYRSICCQSDQHWDFELLIIVFLFCHNSDQNLWVVLLWARLHQFSHPRYCPWRPAEKRKPNYTYHTKES